MSKRQTWMGHAGHFIGGRNCSFHLNTHVNGYIISTVGEYRPSVAFDGDQMRPRRDADPPMPIGGGKDSVFVAESYNSKCCPFVMESGTELVCERYATADAAAEGHARYVEEWGSK